MTSTTWVSAAAAKIREVLAELPADAGEADCSRAIRDAYPWEPRAHWPYKAWLKARKAALDARFGRMTVPVIADAQISLLPCPLFDDEDQPA